MASMIDDGFKVAICGVGTGQEVEVFVTYWEEPERGRAWPIGIFLVFEERHEGVFCSSS
jgi:hypothetical protein